METITIKAGKVPGTITEVVVEKGTSVNSVLELAGISDVAGYEVRVGGNSANVGTILEADTSVLLMKQIKGNGTIIVKVGKVPGTIQEIAVDSGANVDEVLGIAGINDITGYEVRVGGNTATLATTLTSDTSVLLMKQIKGNAAIMVKVGKVPGTIQEIAVDNGASVSDVLALAGITDVTGYEVRVAGNSANVGTVLTSDTSVLLMKQIKGNK